MRAFIFQTLTNRSNMKKCPKCFEELSIDHTPEFDENMSYEIVCYGCGWFAMNRYATLEDADEND